MSTMGYTFVSLCLIAYLPGALIYRMPFAERARRAALPAEERAFWAVIISVILTSTLTLGLAAVGQYTFGRLLAGNAVIAAIIAIAVRGRLRFGPEAPRPGWTAVIPVLLVVSSVWWYFAVPPAEYVLGGRDPGVYMNQGIQIAQRRSLVTTDATVASVPEATRDLFFPPYGQPGYYSVRFMGFFLTDPGAGAVVGQFPHLYPSWIAIAYGLDGLSGARRAMTWWAILGVLAVYFAGTRLVGRPEAAAAATLLSMHVIEVWYARYPNSEMVLQALLFAALLAHAYTHEEDDRFFGPVAASLLGLALFARLPAVLAVGATGAVGLFAHVNGRRLRAGFLLSLAAWTTVAVVYYVVRLAPYAQRPREYFDLLQPIHLFLWSIAGVGGFALLLATRHQRVARAVQRAVPIGLVVVVSAGALYAYFFREPGERLAPQDAHALRTFAQFYLTPLGLALAIGGWALVVWRSFWRAPALIVTVATFAFFFFYKLRIFPEHFWMARRFLEVILPAALLFASAAAFYPLSHLFRARWAAGRGTRIARVTVGVFILVLLARDYSVAAWPIRTHVEYAGLISTVERLAGRFGNEDLVLIEAREASDLHVLALPLAYIYARTVLVFYRESPNRAQLVEFLAWARERYDNVFFIGATDAGGSQIVAPSVGVELVGEEHLQVPEYEQPFDTYPRAVLGKPFNFRVYRLIERPPPEGPWSLDVGENDDLRVAKFHAQERLGGGAVTFRWTRNLSNLTIDGLHPSSREVVLWLSDGGRPPSAGPASVTVHLEDQPLGSVVPGTEFRDYHFPIPAALAEALASRPEGVTLRIETSTWVPRDVVGGPDSRPLGVMLDRVELR